LFLPLRVGGGLNFEQAVKRGDESELYTAFNIMGHALVIAFEAFLNLFL